MSKIYPLLNGWLQFWPDTCKTLCPPLLSSASPCSPLQYLLLPQSHLLACVRSHVALFYKKCLAVSMDTPICKMFSFPLQKEAPSPVSGDSVMSLTQGNRFNTGRENRAPKSTDNLLFLIHSWRKGIMSYIPEPLKS